MLHYGRPGTLDELKPGMMFTIEPMINAGRREIRETGRRLDHRHARPVAVGAVGAHRARHRQRLRSDDALGRLAAAAGLRQPADGRVRARRVSRRRRRANRRTPRRRPSASCAPATATARPRCSSASPRRGRRRAPPLTLIRALAGQVDETLLELWQRCGMPAGAALVAVGGYGRGELFPHSDVDVLVLLPGDGTQGLERMRQATERFITDCWDTGLEIGSSVRTVDECVAMAASDVTVQTALLESRFLCGDRKVFTAFQKATRQGDGRQGVPARQDAGDAPAPPEVREHALLARAELQGEPGRPARPADRDLGGARRRPRPHLAASSPPTA